MRADLQNWDAPQCIGSAFRFLVRSKLLYHLQLPTGVEVNRVQYRVWLSQDRPPPDKPVVTPSGLADATNIKPNPTTMSPLCFNTGQSHAGFGKDSAHRRIRGGFRFHTVFALLRHLEPHFPVDSDSVYAGVP